MSMYEQIKSEVWERLIARAGDLKQVATHIDLVWGDSERYRQLYESGALKDYTVPPDDFMRETVEAMLAGILAETDLSAAERQKMLDEILTDVVDFGPLESLLQDPDVLEIMVDRYDRIYVERRGRLEDAGVAFRDEARLMKIIHRILAPTGRRIDAANPIVDARLPDGSRCNIVLPPIAMHGPTLVIRKFPHDQPHFEELIRWGSISEDHVKFLRACMIGRCNIIVSGGTGSGKTTVLNRIMELIPPGERTITVESVLEVQPPKHLTRLVRLESRPPDDAGKGEISMRDLVTNALKMRPDRLVVGELRGGEALDLLSAMNTGHDGSMASMHANSPRDALARLETLVSMANAAIPLMQMRQLMASAIDLITHQERLGDGSRKIIKMTEVVGMQGGEIELQDIFEFRQTGIDAHGKITGYFTPTGYIPAFMERVTNNLHLQGLDLDLPDDFFTPREA
ncbi:MAG: CpaF family protein [Anaerolineae bacterium]|nr:CpaF family protein [Anaerolineae bacterium]